MLRIVILGCGALGAYVAGKKVIEVFHEKASGGGGTSGSPMNVIARGVKTLQTQLGPWSVQDLSVGLAAIAKLTEKELPQPPGEQETKLSQDALFLNRAQHWRAIAEAAYVCDPASFSLFSHLPESAIVGSRWEADHSSLRPAYVVCIDAPYGAVVLTVRGTSQIVDMLVNAGTSAEAFLTGSGHGGFVHATAKLLEDAEPHLEKAFKEHGTAQEELKLVICGHSLGAAVAIMAGFKLREKYPNVECWGYSTPACLTLDLARECNQFATSFVANHDIVPRFSLHAVELLRKRVCDFDWDKSDEVLHGDEDWENIKKASKQMKKWQKKQQGLCDNVAEKAAEAKEALGLAGNNGDNDKKKDGKEERHERKEEKQEQKEEKAKHPPLFAPGRLLVLSSDPPGSGLRPEQRPGVPDARNLGTYPNFEEAKNVKWVMHEADQKQMSEIVISPWCVTDHMLGNIGQGIYYFQTQCQPSVLSG